MSEENEISKKKMSDTTKWIISILASIIATVCGAWYSDYKSKKSSGETNELVSEMKNEQVVHNEEQISIVENLQTQVSILTEKIDAMVSVDIINLFNPQDFPDEYKSELRAAAERIKNPDSAKEYFLLYYVAQMDNKYDEASKYLRELTIKEPVRVSKKPFQFSKKEEAEEYGKTLWENWKIANIINYDSTKLHNQYEVVFVEVHPDYDGSGMFVLRNDFTTESEAKSFSRLLRYEKHIENDIINRGFLVVWKNETPGVNKFLVSVGAFPERSKAVDFGETLNIKYEVIYSAAQSVYRVIVNSYDDKKEADERVKQYKHEHKTDKVWVANRELSGI